MEPNVIDKLISWISPAAGRRRMIERRLLGVETRAYSAADRGRRTDGWTLRVGQGPNSIIGKSLPLIRERSHDLVRNNTWAASIIREVTANLTHYGIIASFTREKGGKASDDVPEIWLRWAETTICDSAGKKTLYDIQRLVAQTWAESGEVFVRRVWRDNWRPGEIPFTLQVLEPEFIDTTRDMVDGRKLGIKFDDNGAVVNYLVYEKHPSESPNAKSKPIAAADMIHMYFEDRPGQIRGVPLLATPTLRLYDLDNFEQAELVKQEVAAMYAGYRKRLDPNGGRDYEENNADDGIDSIQPGMIETLRPDEDIVFSNPPQRSGYADYVKQNVMAASAAVGPTYEGVSGDFGGVTFLNGRMAQMRFHRRLDQWQYLMFIPQFCQRVAEWFCEGALFAGEDLSDVRIEWQPPVKQMVDPGREIAANEKAVRSGAMTQFEMIRSYGNDPVRFLHDRKREQELMDTLGIVFSTDVRKVSGAGQLQNDKSNMGSDANSDGKENSDGDEK